MSAKPKVTVLWIGEKAPDLFSWWIQFWLSIRRYKGLGNKARFVLDTLKGKNLIVNFSHNAIVYNGQFWHATTPGGVRCDDHRAEMKDSKVRAYKEIELDVSVEWFEGWLKDELGKSYGFGQNYGFVLYPLRHFFANGDRHRNCSEFVAKVAQLTLAYRSNYANCLDFISPDDNMRILEPTVLKEDL